MEVVFFHSVQILEKVYVQFQSFLEDPQYKDQHELQATMIRTFGKVAPHAEPHFRDEGIVTRRLRGWEKGGGGGGWKEQFEFICSYKFNTRARVPLLILLASGMKSCYPVFFFTELIVVILEVGVTNRLEYWRQLCFVYCATIRSHFLEIPLLTPIIIT